MHTQLHINYPEQPFLFLKHLDPACRPWVDTNEVRGKSGSLHRTFSFQFTDLCYGTSYGYYYTPLVRSAALCEIRDMVVYAWKEVLLGVEHAGERVC